MIIRSDVPPGVQLAQTIHAAGQSAQALDAYSASPPTVAVALAASPAELALLARALAEADVRHVLVHEPDEPWRGEQFATLEQQRAWLDERAATLVMLSEGKLP